MLVLIAWRNVWRNKLRSLLVIISITLGLLGAVFLMSFSFGMNEQRTRNILDKEISHIQMHDSLFKDERAADKVIPNAAEKLAFIQKIDGVNAATGRVSLIGSAKTARSSVGVQINGVNPSEEALVTQLEGKVIEGDYFKESKSKSNQIIISQKLADKLKVRLRKKVILTFQDKEGDIKDVNFKVVGIYQSINKRYDEWNVFTRITDMQRELGDSAAVHEIAVLAIDKATVPFVAAKIKDHYPEMLTEDWAEIAPDLKVMAESFDQYMYIFMMIILLALAFGIINTMLMAVLERVRELGMLMAIGMNKMRVFLMIMLETLFLSIIGGPLGILAAFMLVSYFGSTGIDLSSMSDSLSEMGMDTCVYTYIQPSYYFRIALMTIFTAFISSLYPSFKALSLRPVEAIRKI